MNDFQRKAIQDAINFEHDDMMRAKWSLDRRQPMPAIDRQDALDLIKRRIDNINKLKEGL